MVYLGNTSIYITSSCASSRDRELHHTGFDQSGGEVFSPDPFSGLANGRSLGEKVRSLTTKVGRGYKGEGNI
jgi:hypothetical protein